MQQFVFLPDRRSNTEELVSTLEAVIDDDATLDFLAAPAALGIGSRLKPMSEADSPDRRGLEILALVRQSGAALVSTSRDGPAPSPRGGNFYPIVNYTMAIADARFGRVRLAGGLGPIGTDFLNIALVSKMDQGAIVGALAILRLKGSNQQLRGVSDATGIVRFGLRAGEVVDAMLAIEPGFAGHWGYFQSKVSFRSGDVFELDAVGLGSSQDSLRHFVEPGGPDTGKGVVVAVIDSGVGPHDDLRHVAGDVDSSIGHGTHVAGIIAGRGYGGRRGVAPGVAIRSYRVFDDPATGTARNFEIHRAIEQAVDDGCHLINLSLKVENKTNPRQDDQVLSRAIEDAADEGVLTIAAAGNDFRRFVAFPARHRDVIAVSALGWEPGLPTTAYDRWTISDQRGKPDSEAFFASFSNQGDTDTRVDLFGPGAGVVSTVPGNLYAPMSGTSMACPAATGAIARLLAANGEVLSMSRDRARYHRMRQLAFSNLRQMGFGVACEGNGMIV